MFRYRLYLPSSYINIDTQATSNVVLNNSKRKRNRAGPGGRLCNIARSDESILKVRKHLT